MRFEPLLGKVSHYYGHIGVAVVDVERPMFTGDLVHIKGAHDDFVQPVNRMELDHRLITIAEPGKQVAIKVDQKVHARDKVYLIE